MFGRLRSASHVKFIEKCMCMEKRVLVKWAKHGFVTMSLSWKYTDFQVKKKFQVSKEGNVDNLLGHKMTHDLIFLKKVQL